MPIKNYMEYKGRYYDVGTRLKFYPTEFKIWLGALEGVVETFIDGRVFIRATNGRLYKLWPGSYDFEKSIVEIIEPIYYNPPKQAPKKNRNRPVLWDVEIGWVWYIVIMAVGTIFNDRLLIWIIATAIFFIWKCGRLGGNKQ